MSDFLYALSFYTAYSDGGGVIVFILCLLCIAYGILSCFYGYKIFKFITGVCGFIIGTVLGFIITIGTGGSDVSGPALVIPTLLVGVIGAFLAVKLYYIGVFLVGALFGGLLGFALTAASNNGIKGPVILLLAIIAGILAVIIRKFMIILSTSVSGAQTISSALTVLIYVMTGNEYDVINNFLWIILAIAGFSYQYSINKNAPIDPVTQSSGGASGINPVIRGFQSSKLAKYKKPIIITFIIILVFILFAPRMPLGLVLLITAAAVGIYIMIDRRTGNSTGNTGIGAIHIVSGGTGPMTGSGAGTLTGSGIGTNAGSGTGPAAGGGASMAISSLRGEGRTGSLDAVTSNLLNEDSPESLDTVTISLYDSKIECEACHSLNNAGSKFCGKCGNALASIINSAESMK